MDKKSKVIILMLLIIIIGLIVCIFNLSSDLKEQKERVKDLKDTNYKNTIISNAKEEAAKNSVYAIFDAAKLYYTESLILGDKKVYQTGNDATELNTSGVIITSGTWDFDYNTGTITLVNVVIGDYTCNGNVNNVKCKKNK